VATKLIPDPNRPGSFIEEPIVPVADSPHYLTVPIDRETFGALDGFRYSPLLAFLAWAQEKAGWELNFSDVAISGGVLGALRAAGYQWAEKRRMMGFLHEETAASMGVEGIHYPFVNPDVPAGHVLLMRKP
jgi:hypothetical protein